MRPFLGLRAVPSEADGRSLRLVLIEDGVREIASRVQPDGGYETIVVRQDGGESATRWTRRVVGRIAALEQSDRRIASCTLLTSASVDGASMESRETVIRDLLRHSAATGPSSIVLVAEPDGAGPEQRHELLSLVEKLIAEGGNRSASILLRFPSDERRPPKSGTRHRLPARHAALTAGDHHHRG